MTDRQFLARIGTIQAIFAIASIVYSASLLGKVRDPMATKFTLAGEPTQYSNPLATFILMSAVIIGLMAMFLALKGMRAGAVARFNAGFSTATVVFVSTLSAAMFHINAYPESSFGQLTLLSLGASIAVGLLAAVIISPVPTDDTPPPAVPEVTVPAGGAASWSSTATMSAGASITLWLLVAALFIGGVATALMSGEMIGAAIMIGCGFVVAFAVWAFSSFTVNVNKNGISYRSPVKVPNTSLDYSTIEKVEVAHISPGDWGGWGLRQRPGGLGLITRKGKGLRITHSGGRVTEITCTNPEIGAGLAAQHMK